MVRTVMRWGQSGVSCEFYNWKEDDPEMFSAWFSNRKEYRERRINAGFWSDDDERAHQAECIRRTPENYYGWWELKNLPGGYSDSEWFSPFGNYERPFDPQIPIAEVEKALQEKTFDDWRDSDHMDDISYHTRESIESMIAYWRQEQLDGCSYYGDENENPTARDREGGICS